MSEPTDEQINKAIAEYMGTVEIEIYEQLHPNYLEREVFPLYTESLDRLVPVVEKLGLNMNLSFQPSKKKYRSRVWEYNKSKIYLQKSPPPQNESPSQALARACYESIVGR